MRLYLANKHRRGTTSIGEYYRKMAKRTREDKPKVEIKGREGEKAINNKFISSKQKEWSEEVAIGWAYRPSMRPLTVKGSLLLTQGVWRIIVFPGSMTDRDWGVTIKAPLLPSRVNVAKTTRLNFEYHLTILDNVKRFQKIVLEVKAYRV